MTSFESNPMDALEALLEERRRYEGWLSQLEARRGDSPSHVVDRVRSDYLTRLASVIQKLRGRAEDLTATAAALRGRAAALLADETTRRDERAELELRAMVGEFAPSEAQQAMQACDDAIGHLMTERGGLEGELARMTEVLALIAAPAVTDPPPSQASTVSVPEGTASAPPSEAVVDEPLAWQERATASALETSSLMPADPSALDELAFLQSVVSDTRDEARPQPPKEPSIEPAPAAPSASAPTPAESGADLLPPPVLAAPRRPVTPLSTSIPTTRDPFASTSMASTLTPGSIPSFLKDMPTEQVKTLKCQECGTMNYPTEWYCERCGGELAAM